MAHDQHRQHGGQQSPFSPAPAPVAASGQKNTIIAFLVGLLIGAGATWLGLTVAQPEDGQVHDDQPASGTTTPTDTTDSNGVSADDNRIVVTDQRPGTVVDVESVSLAKPGWVVIHEMRNGGLGNALGAGWFDAGTEQFGRVNLLRGLEAETEYYAVLYDDAGDDRLFDLDTDTPLEDARGNRIQVTFTAVPPPAAAGN